ncbi:unnamed protein product [Mortierella alpina]
MCAGPKHNATLPSLNTSQEHAASLGRLRLCQAMHTRAIHPDMELILEALKERLDMNLQFNNDAQRLKKRQDLVRAMKVCDLARATDRALFQALVAKHNRISLEGKLDKPDVSTGDEPTSEKGDTPKERTSPMESEVNV